MKTLEEIIASIDEACGPDEMSKDEAIDFMYEIVDNLRARIAALDADGE